MGKRKNFIFVLVILLCLPLAACGKNGSGTEKSTELKAFALSAQSAQISLLRQYLNNTLQIFD